MRKYRKSVSSSAFSPDGTILATGGWYSESVLDGSVISLWKIPEGELIRKLDPMKSAVGQIVFSPDGKLLATASGNSTFTNRYASLFGKDKTYFDKEIHLWNPENGLLVGKLKKHTAMVTSVAFSPNGKYLASASLDKTVHIWNVSTKKVIASLKGHESGVLCVAFSPDGKLLATGSYDTTILLWDIQALLSRR